MKIALQTACSLVLLVTLAASAANAQPDSPATDVTPAPGDPGRTMSKAGDGSTAAPTDSIDPIRKPSMEGLATKSVVPLPSTGATGVKPPPQPGAANSAPPDAGSKP